MRRLVLSLAASGLFACADQDPPHLRTLVTVIATQEGRTVEEATTRLVAEGRRGLVVIEAALHTAPPAGRRRLVRAIDRIGDVDACALLRHLARYDDAVEVRDAARAVLVAWAADEKKIDRATGAKRALAALPKPPISP